MDATNREPRVCCDVQTESSSFPFYRNEENRSFDNGQDEVHCLGIRDLPQTFGSEEDSWTLGSCFLRPWLIPSEWRCECLRDHWTCHFRGRELAFHLGWIQAGSSWESPFQWKRLHCDSVSWGQSEPVHRCQIGKKCIWQLDNDIPCRRNGKGYLVWIHLVLEEVRIEWFRMATRELPLLFDWGPLHLDLGLSPSRTRRWRLQTRQGARCKKHQVQFLFSLASNACNSLLTGCRIHFLPSRLMARAICSWSK